MIEASTLFAQMRKQLITLHPVDDTSWAEFSSIWVPVTYKRKKIITVAGEIERQLY